MTISPASRRSKMPCASLMRAKQRNQRVKVHPSLYILLAERRERTKLFSFGTEKCAHAARRSLKVALQQVKHKVCDRDVVLVTFFVPVGAMLIAAETGSDAASLRVWEELSAGSPPAFIMQGGCGSPDVTAQHCLPKLH